MLSREREEQYWKDMKAKAEERRIVLVLSKDPSAAQVLNPYIDGFNLIRIGQVEKLRHQINTLFPHAIMIDRAFVEKQDITAILSHLPYDLPIITFNFPGNLVSLHDLPACVKGYLVKPVAGQTLIDTVHSLGKGVHRLLVVDDDSSMQSFIARTLSSSGDGRRRKNNYSIVSTGTIAATLHELNSSPPDAVLLDLGLPDGNGWEILKVVEPMNIPVVFITAQDYPQMLPSEGIQEALNVMMHRPLGRLELNPILQSLLESIQPTYPLPRHVEVHSTNLPG
jgi:CheY-like chemotaxis protein